MKSTSSILMPDAISRREMLERTSMGFGWLAFSALAQARSVVIDPTAPLAPRAGHHPAKAKRVIFVFFGGGPSHLDTFDWKPELATAGGRYLAPQFEFKPRGKSGLMISDAFPALGKQADDLCLINSAQTNNPGHSQAIAALHTGSEVFVRPSLGAWTTYGLGTDAQDLPGFITLNPISDQGGAMNYGSAFLPATFQGTRVGTGGGVPDLYCQHLSVKDQRRQLDLVQTLNRRFQKTMDPGSAEIDGIIQSYELAAKMQTSVPEVFDLAEEPAHIQDLYGIGGGATDSFGRACLMARRLAEKGVRFIQLTTTGWDHHNNIRTALEDRATGVDVPLAGLIEDLRQRDMLKDTLIVGCGEFGRGASEDNGGGRGHQASGFTVWMCGGGIKGGLRYGSTDELGVRAVENVMPTADLHATILHLLGLNHIKLTYRYAGRDFRLTNVDGEVHHGIIA